MSDEITIRAVWDEEEGYIEYFEVLNPPYEPTTYDDLDDVYEKIRQHFDDSE